MPASPLAPRSSPPRPSLRMIRRTTRPALPRGKNRRAAPSIGPAHCSGRSATSAWLAWRRRRRASRASAARAPMALAAAGPVTRLPPRRAKTPRRGRSRGLARRLRGLAGKRRGPEASRLTRRPAVTSRGATTKRHRRATPASSPPPMPGLMPRGSTRRAAWAGIPASRAAALPEACAIPTAGQPAVAAPSPPAIRGGQRWPASARRASRPPRRPPPPPRPSRAAASPAQCRSGTGRRSGETLPAPRAASTAPLAPETALSAPSSAQSRRHPFRRF